MYLKKIKLIALTIILAVAEAGAQNITSSPYSRYGLGDICTPGTGQNIAMGGTSAAESNTMYVNTVNPACNTSMLPQHFVFDVGFDVKYTDIKSASNSEKTSKTTFKHLAGGFAAKPWWYFAFYMKPYSAMGFSMNNALTPKEFDGETYPYQEYYEGKGGLNKVSIATAFKFFKMLSIGFTGSTLFGNIERTQKSSMSRTGYIINGTSYPYSSQFYMKDKRMMHGVQGDIGFRFEKRWRSRKDSLRDAVRISLGAFINSQAKLKARDEMFMENYHQYYTYYDYNSTYYTAKTDTIFNDTLSRAKVKIPGGFGFGASMVFAEKLTINADYHTQKWSEFSLPDDASNVQMRNSKYMGFGLQYMEANYSSKYYRTIIYRIGAYKQETYLTLNGRGIDDKGITFGLGFPLRQMLLLNVSCQIGTRGTTEHNLYKEKYFLVHFNATLHDYWFIKRKFQ